MQDPVFILSLRPRSGTNIFWFHLLQHPDIVGGSLYEDYFATHLPHLVRFVEDLGRSQKRLITGPVLHNRLIKDLKMELAYSLKRIIYAPHDRYLPIPVSENTDANHSKKRLITKTPSIEGLEYVFDFFPKAKVLILLRDPRDVIDSEMKAFGREFREQVLAWRDAARILLKFWRQRGQTNGCKVVRYEDVCGKPEEVIRDTLNFLELNTEAYDFSKIKSAPVIGSSDDFVKGSWTYKEKTENFKSIGKWHNWHAQRLEYFKKIAGEEARILGYE